MHVTNLRGPVMALSLDLVFDLGNERDVLRTILFGCWHNTRCIEPSKIRCSIRTIKYTRRSI